MRVIVSALFVVAMLALSGCGGGGTSLPFDPAQARKIAEPARADIPLHAAALVGDLAVVEKLIAAGANPNTHTNFGSTPLHYAAENNDNPAIVEVLIAGGANPNARDADGRFPFDHAKNNKALQGTDVYWRLNEARFE